MKKPIMSLLIGILSLVNVNVMAAEQASIVFATDADYPPYEYMNSKGEFRGFDIDIAKAICNNLNAHCQFVNKPWESLIPGLQSGEFDAAISAIDITPARRQQVDFSQPYISEWLSIVAKRKSDFSLTGSSLKATVGVLKDTTQADYMKQHYGSKVTLKSYTNPQRMFTDLVQGHLSAVADDTAVVMHWLHTDGHSVRYFAVNNPPIKLPSSMSQGLGIAVKKGNEKLLKRLNRGLKVIRLNGTLKFICVRYLLPNCDGE